MPDLTREQLIQLAVQKIVSDPSLRFLIILDDNVSGVQIMPSEKSFVWLQGVISISEKLVDEGIRAFLRSALDERNMKANMDDAFAMVTKDEVKN